MIHSLMKIHWVIFSADLFTKNAIFSFFFML